MSTWQWLSSLRSLNHSVRPPSQSFGEDAPAWITYKLPKVTTLKSENCSENKKEENVNYSEQDRLQTLRFDDEEDKCRISIRFSHLTHYLTIFFMRQFKLLALLQLFMFLLQCFRIILQVFVLFYTGFCLFSIESFETFKLFEPFQISLQKKANSLYSK